MLFLSCVALQYISALGAADEWSLHLLAQDADQGSVCLDGSPGAVYIKPGIGVDMDRWILFFEGGGWCQSLEDCRQRAPTVLGSSRNYSRTTTHWASRDLLNTNCTINPKFCNYSSAYAPYCDGVSRSSNALAPVQVGNEQLYFRGYRILVETIAALLQRPGLAGAPSLADATELLVSGSSAGGLTTYLHIDTIAAAVRAANPTIVIKAVPEVGFFINGNSIWGGARLQTDAFARLAAFANVTGGLPEQVNSACVTNTTPALRWQCFMAQYTLPYIQTPTFMLNSVVDQWQTQHILAPDPNTTVTVVPYAPFLPCIHAPMTACNKTQKLQWTNYSSQFLDALAAAREATPPEVAERSGGFITSCPIHTTAISGISHRIKIGGVSMYEALVKWYTSPVLSGTPKGGDWTFDVAYPGDKSCPSPAEVDAALAFA